MPTTLPVVLTPEEVAWVLGFLRGTHRLVGLLLYGSGLRVTECLMLRVKDLDLERGELTVRRGKGGKNRVTVIPRPCEGHSGSISLVSRRCMIVTWEEVADGSRRRGVWMPSTRARVRPGHGNGYSPLGGVTGIRRVAASCGTTSTSRSCSEP